MSSATARLRLHELLTSETYTYTNAIAPIFDGLSARIAEATGWDICVLAGSKMKAVNVGLPDEIDNLVTITDKAEAIRQVRRCAPDIAILADVDNAGGSPMSAFRLIRELEAAGITGVEIEDRTYSNRFEGGGDFYFDQDTPPEDWAGSSNFGFHPIEEFCGILEAALAAREDPNTVIFARPATFSESLTGGHVMDKDEAIERIRAYSQTGVQGIMMPGEHGHVRQDIETIHAVTDLPQMVLRMPPDVVSDKAFLEKNNVRLRRVGQPTVHMTADAIFNSLMNLEEGGDGIYIDNELNERMQVPDYVEMLELVSRASEFAELDSGFRV